jgi:hypothetical protein
LNNKESKKNKLGMPSSYPEAFVLKDMDDVANEEKMKALALNDHLNRRESPELTLRDEGRIMKVLLSQNGDILARIMIHTDEWVTYRAPDDLLERHQNNGGLIEFPVTEFYDPHIWKFLLDYSVNFLRSNQKKWAFLICPVDCRQAMNLAVELGFQTRGLVVSKGYRLKLGFDEDCVLLNKELNDDLASHQVDIYPYANSSKIRSQAKSSDAPTPDIEFWSKASPLYSGYSAYPFMDRLIEETIGVENSSRILSAPSATCDFIRFLPLNFQYDSIHGYDIMEQFMYFGRKRLENPAMDVINRFFIHLFYENDLSGNVSSEEIIKILYDIGKIFGSNTDDIYLKNVFSSLRSAFKTCIKNPVIADYWIITKGIAGFVFHQDLNNNVHPLVFVSKLFDSLEFKRIMYQYISRYNWLPFGKVQAQGEMVENLFHNGKIELKCKNVLDVEKNEIGYFSLIFAFECLLMFEASGLQEKFLEAMVKRLDKKGVLILTGIRNNNGNIPAELKKAKEFLHRKGMKAYDVHIQIKPTCLVTHDMNEKITPYIYAMKP